MGREYPLHHHISIHAPRAGRDCLVLADRVVGSISIHAPRAGRDCPSARSVEPSPHFIPRAPCGARQGVLTKVGSWIEFQSTRPVRGATAAGEAVLALDRISIHAPRAGRDPVWAVNTLTSIPFQSTRPVRGATGITWRIYQVLFISIHAPRAGRDRRRASRRSSPCRNFNPRAPCGARPSGAFAITKVGGIFQSTRPVRGATTFGRVLCPECQEFQSTRPVRGATILCEVFGYDKYISIHAPRAGRDPPPSH